MAKPGKKQNRADSIRSFKRRHILAAARRIFAEKGLDGLNMRAIAAEAGYSLGAAYAYFQTKEEIQLELLATILNELTRHIKAASTSPTEDKSTNRRAFSLVADYFCERPEERRLLLLTLPGLAAEDAKIPPVVRKEFDSRLLTLMGLLANSLHRIHSVPPALSQEETIDFVAFLLGLLMLENGGRLQLLNQQPQEMVDRYAKRMLLRLAQ